LMWSGNCLTRLASGESIWGSCSKKGKKNIGGRCHSFWLFILVSYSTLVYEYIRHTFFFCLGFALWMYLQDDRKLVFRGAELLWLLLGLKSVEELCLAPNGTRTHASHISGSNGPVSECPPA
jgi:hypothetical protein